MRWSSLVSAGSLHTNCCAGLAGLAQSNDMAAVVGVALPAGEAAEPEEEAGVVASEPQALSVRTARTPKTAAVSLISADYLVSRWARTPTRPPAAKFAGPDPRGGRL